MKSTAERRQQIIEYLCQVRFTTRSQLMREFDISKNTVDRDLQILMCSYPIETTKGNGGGVRVANSYYLGNHYMTSEQKDLLERLSENLSANDLAIMNSIIRIFTKR